MVVGSRKTGAPRDPVGEKLHRVWEAIQAGRYDCSAPGRYDVEDGVELLVQEYETVDEASVPYEKHEHSVELIYIASGREAVYWCPAQELTQAVTEYEASKDRTFFKDPAEGSRLVLEAGDFIAVYPWDGHKTRCHTGEGPERIRKYLVKIWL